MFEVRHYLTDDDVDPFAVWFDALRDRVAKARIAQRIDRVALGNLGDWKSVGNGVCELRVDHGAGYRIYYGMAGAEIVLLLIGGDKRTQAADIKTAHRYWQDWQTRK
jgi:putative addiction module killer protein